MTYNEFIQNIIVNRGQWAFTEEDIYEIHHILPRCMGGGDEESNLVLMNYRCHVLAHCLLFLMNQENASLATAAWCKIYAADSNRGERDINNLILSFEIINFFIINSYFLYYLLKISYNL